MLLDYSPLLILMGLALIILIVILKNSMTIVGGQQTAVLERRWFGSPLPEGRVVALSNEIGIQARILGPGLHLLTPFLYKVSKAPLVIIGEDEVGLVESIDGQPVAPGRIFGLAKAEHNLFQDGEAFLRSGAEKGPQIQILPPGSYRINPYLFKVTAVPTVSIGNNQIGVVVATDGEQIAPGRLLGRKIESHNHFQNGQSFLEGGGQKGPQIEVLLPGSYRINSKLFEVKVTNAVVIPAKKIGLVTARDGLPLPTAEYVAKSVTGHRDYQDAAEFLASGGQRGPQLDFLTPGTYYVNPMMFEVVLDDVLSVERGEVAVIVSNIGRDPHEVIVETGVTPPENLHRDKDQIYVVNAGFRGIQKDVLGPGTYYQNKLAFISHIIPTTNITIDWAEDMPRKDSSLAFNPLAIVSRDGFEMTVEVKVIIRVQPQQAPFMVARIGTISNLIEHVIHPLIDSSFRNQASSSEAMKFLQDRHEEQRRAEEHVIQELVKYHVECVSVLICQIKLPERLMQTLTSKVVATQQKAMYDAQQEAEGRRSEMEKTKAEADLQPNLVKAEIDVKIASQQKQQQIILAEGRGQSTRLEQEGIASGVASVGHAEAEKIGAIGEATAEAYQKQAAALGSQPMAIIEIMKQIAGGGVKITPDVLVQGAEGEGGNVLSAFIASLMAQNMKGPGGSNPTDLIVPPGV